MADSDKKREKADLGGKIAESLCKSYGDIMHCFDGANILITGAGGLIGSTLVKALLHYGKYSADPAHVTALVRNEERARGIFANELCEYSGNLELICADVTDADLTKKIVDQGAWDICRTGYIIHTAGKTASRDFLSDPVGTIDINYLGTKNILELAKKIGIKGMAYLSSMEVYGYPQKGHKVKESDTCSLDPSKLRSCYPISKLMCENLCLSYAKKYDLPVMTLRLSQVFGLGVNDGDMRFCDYIAGCAAKGENIILRSTGETERSYIYIADAVTAILTVLIKGEAGEIYNAANEDTYCSVKDMAQLVASIGGINVEYDIDDKNDRGYLDTLYMNLDTSKLKSLGWRAETGLKEGFKRQVVGER